MCFGFLADFSKSVAVPIYTMPVPSRTGDLKILKPLIAGDPIIEVFLFTFLFPYSVFLLESKRKWFPSNFILVEEKLSLNFWFWIVKAKNEIIG